MLVAVVCVFTGLCYAELASMIPIAGSAYTYTYATLGELVAWIIGWDLILEYAFSNMSVSVGFAAHIEALLEWFGVHFPLKWISPAYLPTGTAGPVGEGPLPARVALRVQHSGVPGGDGAYGDPGAGDPRVGAHQQHHGAGEDRRDPGIYLRRPPALSSRSTGIRSCPTAGRGCSRAGRSSSSRISGSIRCRRRPRSARRPQRDLPFGILSTLVACTLLYGGVAICLSGIVPWNSIMGDGAPVVNALKRLVSPIRGSGLHWVELIVLIGAMLGMISSILVFQLGQARVWFAMSRDGLLPDIFSRIHARFRTPAVATWVAGFVVGIPAGLLDIGTVSNLSNIGTLFAFVLVSIAVIILRYREPERHRAFRAPFGPVFPVLSIIFCIVLMMGLEVLTWTAFFIWLVTGLVIYFFYSRHRSEFAPAR